MKVEQKWISDNFNQARPSFPFNESEYMVSKPCYTGGNVIHLTSSEGGNDRFV